MGGLSASTTLPDFVGSATLVAVIVMFWEVEMVAGAVYSPALEIVPTEGLMPQVTAVLEVFVTVAANCCVWALNKVTLAGPAETGYARSELLRL